MHANNNHTHIPSLQQTPPHHEDHSYHCYCGYCGGVYYVSQTASSTRTPTPPLPQPRFLLSDHATVWCLIKLLVLEGPPIFLDKDLNPNRFNTTPHTLMFVRWCYVWCTFLDNIVNNQLPTTHQQYHGSAYLHSCVFYSPDDDV